MYVKIVYMYGKQDKKIIFIYNVQKFNYKY